MQKNLITLKRLFHIRNRFWRKKYSELKDDILTIYETSLKYNYLPFYLSIKKMLIKIRNVNLSEDKIEELYLSSFVHYLNKFKKFTFLIDNKQKAKLIKIKSHVYISIINPDGTDDPIKTKILKETNKNIIDHIKKNYTNIRSKNIDFNIEIFLNLIKPNYSKFYKQEKYNVIQDFIDSPIGKIINSWIPGVSIILEIQKLKEEIQSNNTTKIIHSMIIKNIVNSTKYYILNVAKKLSPISKYVIPPAGILSDFIFERYESYTRCEEILNNNYHKIHLIYNEIQNDNISDFVLDSKEPLKKLLDLS